jgi:hypothetical protein
MISGIRLLLLSLVLLLAAQTAAAIPAFARKYDMSCITCHRPAPKLKDYGADFAGNAFQLPDKEPPRFTRETGDEWLLLMREFPLAVRFDAYARWLPNTEGQTDFQWPYGVKLLSGGLIAKDIAYYFYFFMGERGEVAGLEDTYLMFNNVLNVDFDIYLGQFQVSDPLFKRELRLTFEDYQIYRIHPGLSNINLTYDRGVMMTLGFDTGTFLALQVLNGSGIGPADPDRNFDYDKYKPVALRVSQDVGEHLRVGLFGYYGNETLQGDHVSTVSMWGPDLTLTAAQWELNVQYLERRDSDPVAPGSGVDPRNDRSRGGFAELIFTPSEDDSRWFGVLLYNWYEIGPGVAKYHTATASFSYLLARNLRFLGEYGYDFVRSANLLTAGFVAAF